MFNKLNFQRTDIVLQELHPFMQSITDELQSTPLVVSATADRIAASNFSVAQPTVHLSTITNSISTNLTMETLTKLTPEYVAKNEKILKLSRHGEELFQTWSSLNIKDKVLHRFMCIDQNHHYSGSSSCSNRINQSEVKQQFIIILQATQLSTSLPSRIFRALFPKSWNPSHLIRYIGYKPYLFTPMILLRNSATHLDVFDALVIVNRIAYIVSQKTLAKPTHSLQTSNDSRNVKLAEEMLTDTNIDDDCVGIVKSAYLFHKTYNNAIKELLSKLGWDLSKFMYGDVTLRVDWE